MRALPWLVLGLLSIDATAASAQWFRFRRAPRQTTQAATGAASPLRRGAVDTRSRAGLDLRPQLTRARSGQWKTPGGLSIDDAAMRQIAGQASNRPRSRIHGIFDEPSRMVSIIDTAWSRIQRSTRSPDPGVESRPGRTVGTTRHVVDFQQRVGRMGGREGGDQPATRVVLIVRGTELLRAYPVPGHEASLRRAPTEQTQRRMRARPEVPDEVARRVPDGFQPRSFRSRQMLDRHFEKHKADFPGLTREEYQQRAIDLLSRPVGGEIKGMTLGNGMVYRFNARTRELAISGPTGWIRTLFKGSTGAWERRVQRAANNEFRRE